VGDAPLGMTEGDRARHTRIVPPRGGDCQSLRSRAGADALGVVAVLAADPEDRELAVALDGTPEAPGPLRNAGGVALGAAQLVVEGEEGARLRRADDQLRVRGVRVVRGPRAAQHPEAILREAAACRRGRRRVMRAAA